MISVVALLAATLFAACDNHAHDEEGHDHEKEAADNEHEHSADEIHFTAAQAKAAQLQVTTLQPTTFSEIIEVSGRVLPAVGAEATVTATMAGIVNFVVGTLNEGTKVGKGQALFVINAKPMADGNPAAVAQSELSAARSAFERAEKLAKEHIISQRELEEARQRYQAATATAQSLGNATQTRSIAANMSGFVKNILVQPGDYVAAGQPLATVTQSQRLQLRAELPERYFSALPRIQSANFRLAYDPSRTYSLNELGGQLIAKGNSAAADDYFVPITFEFNNQGKVVSGSYAEVYLKGAARSGVLCVPNEAIAESQGLHFVYVQIEPEVYRRQEVTLGATDGRQTEISRGLKQGDKVVTHGTTQVRLAANASVAPEGHSH